MRQCLVTDYFSVFLENSCQLSESAVLIQVMQRSVFGNDIESVVIITGILSITHLVFCFCGNPFFFGKSAAIADRDIGNVDTINF